jgi:ribonucleotide monophosphatase NagD (HAD superfamily)
MKSLTSRPKIFSDQHTLDRAEERGTNAAEIRDVIESGAPFQAQRGRSGKSKVYAFGRDRLGRYFEQKRVEVIYTQESDTLVTVTVYVFYGKWEGQG